MSSILRFRSSDLSPRYRSNVRLGGARNCLNRATVVTFLDEIALDRVPAIRPDQLSATVGSFFLASSVIPPRPVLAVRLTVLVVYLERQDTGSIPNSLDPVRPAIDILTTRKQPAICVPNFSSLMMGRGRFVC